MFTNLIRTVIAVQLVCAMIFVLNFALSIIEVRGLNIPWDLLELLEVAAFLGFLIGVGITLAVLRRALLRNREVEDQLLIASGEFNKLVAMRFDEWDLSPAERDVAMLTIKGLSNNEIANLRGKSEGTIKAQSAAIYRKSGMTGRSQLISSFVEDMIGTSEPSLD